MLATLHRAAASYHAPQRSTHLLVARDDLIRAEQVTHMCGAPIVLNALVNMPAEAKAAIDHQEIP